MANKIRIKRGTLAQLQGSSGLALAEMGYCTDVKQVYVGDGAGTNVLVGITAADRARWDGMVPYASKTWQIVYLQNGWVDYGGAYETSSYHKDSDGYVHFRGLIKSGTNSTVVFQLPVGFRPAKSLMMPITSNNKPATMTIAADGNVYLSEQADPVWVSLQIPPFLSEN